MIFTIKIHRLIIIQYPLILFNLSLLEPREKNIFLDLNIKILFFIMFNLVSLKRKTHGTM